MVGTFLTSHDVVKVQNNELQVLANKLSDIITDKDLAIVQYKNTAKILVSRINELERIIETLTGGGDATPVQPNL